MVLRLAWKEPMKKSSHIILVLAVGVFGIITTEMGIIGVLPQISEKFAIAPATAGWLVGIFALVVAAFGPFVTLLASAINRKTVLLAAIAVFALSNFVYAATSSFEVMFAFRVIPALFHPVFFSVALATAARLVPAEQATRAATKVFAGVTIGFAFGVPLTAYLSEHISVAAAFSFGGVVNLVAFVGILALLPAEPVGQRISYGAQVRIMRRPRLWLTIASIVFVFAAMFSVYSYFAEYLIQVTDMDGAWTGVMLMMFGVVMTIGNFLFGGLLQKNLVRTVLGFPILCACLYLLVYAAGPYLVPMVAVVIVWGTVHSGGLIVSQSWLGVDASAAPEFGNSLFISFSNLGIAVGTAVGGWFVSQFGIHQVPWAGFVFAVLALIAIVARLTVGRPSVDSLLAQPEKTVAARA
ncbi:MFS transporter [Rhodococcus sp. TAF43]|uniref:MFS transporter n=1 Tax=Rhodococcus sp. TAF43 TaxID=3237483 RepID=UPI003F9CCCEB